MSRAIVRTSEATRRCASRIGSPTGQLVAVFSLLGVVSLGARSSADHPVRKDMERLGEDLKREQRVLRHLRRTSSSLLEALGGLDRQVQEAEAELEESAARLRELEQRQVESRARQEELVRKRDVLHVRLARRLRQLYMLGEVGWLNLVFDAGSISEGLERLELLRRLAASDRRLAQELLRARERLVETDREIQAQQTELRDVIEQVRGRRERVATARSEKRTALALVQKKAALRKRALVELKRAQKGLAQLVSTIEGEARTARGFSSWRGRLPMPVEGGRVELPFGKQVDERFGTTTLHQGLDIRAPLATPVVAVYPGRVVFADVFRGYGRLVILDHGGGYFTLYAHLGAFRTALDERLAQGQAVGTLGQSGSLKGPYLYFEVRKNGRAVDPAEWLRQEPR